MLCSTYKQLNTTAHYVQGENTMNTEINQAIHNLEVMSGNAINNAIAALEMMSDTFEKLSNTKDNYNSEWGYHLAMMARDYYRDAQVMKEKLYQFGGI